MDGGLDRLVSGLVIAGDVGEARGEPAAPPARLAFGAEHPAADLDRFLPGQRSEEHTSELQSLMRNSYAVFCLQKTNIYISRKNDYNTISYNSNLFKKDNTI